jgi:transmembrane sensor
MSDSDTHSRRPEDRDPTETGRAALAWAVKNRAAGQIVHEIEIRRRRRVRRRLVASTAVILLTGVCFWSASFVRPAPETAIPALARVTTPQSLTLPDGSVVDLRPGAVVDVDFSISARRVILQSGEAHFQVTKDATRPFVVSAADVEVRAVGTAFNVDLAAQAVHVLVTEGLVAVSSHAPGPAIPSVNSSPILVAAGQSTSLPRDLVTSPIVSPVSLEEQGSRLAWRAPMLEFSATTLAEAIPMFNREGAGRQLILDPALGSLTLSGKLRANDIETLLILLRNEFDIVAEPDVRGNLRLSRR